MCRRTYDARHDRKLEWAFVIVNHVIVATGIALAAVGGSKLTEALTEHDRDSDKALLLAGYFIILAAMIGQLVYAALTLRVLRHIPTKDVTTRASGPSVLMMGVLLAVVVLLARIIYSVVFAFTLNPSLSPYTGSLAVKVVPIFLVQLIAALFIGTAGFLTRDMARSQYPQER